MVDSCVLLLSKLCEDWAAAAAKHKAKKLVNFGLFVDLDVLPEKTMHRSVLREYYKLMVHLTGVSDEGHPFFSKALVRSGLLVLDSFPRKTPTQRTLSVLWKLLFRVV